VCNVSEDGLLIRSIQDLPVHEELNVRVFFINGYEFDGIKVVARIVWENHCCEKGWKGYLYEVEFVRISVKNHHKLIRLLRSSSNWRKCLQGRTVPSGILNHNFPPCQVYTYTLRMIPGEATCGRGL